MDSLTQAVLGGTVAYAVLGKRHGAKSALYGAALGTLPDLDVFIDFGGPIENMTYHRGVSHAFAVQLALTPLLAWLFNRWLPASFGRWCLALALVFITHSLADAFTVYGTQVFWPFTDHPAAHAVFFIVDPAFTVPLLVGFIVALALRRSREKALRINAVCLVISTLYLGWAMAAKQYVDGLMQDALTQRGITPDVFESSPGPFNTLVWRGVAVEGDNFHELFVSVFDSTEEVSLRTYARNTALLDDIEGHPSIERLRWFTKGQYGVSQDGNDIVLSDLRMGVQGALVFNFVVGQSTDRGVVLGDFSQRESPPDAAALGLFFKRITNPLVELTPSAYARLR